MRYLKYAGLLGLFVMLAGTAAHAQVRFGVGLGVGPGYVAPPAYVGPAPNCAYGYYGYYPYACATYGYYGPEYFNGGVFLGAGPWFHGYRGYYGPGYRNFGPNYNRGFYGGGGYRGFGGGGFRGNAGGGFRGGNQFPVVGSGAASLAVAGDAD